MIQGSVNPDREPVIRLRIRGKEGSLYEIDAAIDTGFNDYLLLPPSIVATLELTFAAPVRATLGDGQTVQLDYYRATVEWDGSTRDVLVLAAENSPLVGMTMLYGYELYIHVIDGGDVRIQHP